MSEIEGTRPAGVSGGFGIVEPVGEPCDDCGERPGVPHGCIMDDGLHGRHRHGMTHVRESAPELGTLRWLCDPCYRHAIDSELQVQYARTRGDNAAAERAGHAIRRLHGLRPPPVE